MSTSSQTPWFSRWRKEQQLDNLRQDVWPPMITDLRLGFCGKDAKGQPIYYDRPDPQEQATLLSVCPMHQFARWHLATSECLKALQFEAGSERFTGVIDLSKVGIMSLCHASVLTSIVESCLVPESFYPENMDRLFLVNPPRSLQLLWPAMSHFVGEATKKKFHFVDRDEANRQLGLTWNEVPVEFGGTVENGLMTVPEVLQAFEHRSPDLRYGYGKHKTLLPNDVKNDHQTHDSGTHHDFGGKVHDDVEGVRKPMWSRTAAQAIRQYATCCYATCSQIATSSMSAYNATPKSALPDYFAL